MLKDDQYYEALMQEEWEREQQEIADKMIEEDLIERRELNSFATLKG